MQATSKGASTTSQKDLMDNEVGQKVISMARKRSPEVKTIATGINFKKHHLSPKASGNLIRSTQSRIPASQGD